MPGTYSSHNSGTALRPNDSHRTQVFRRLCLMIGCASLLVLGIELLLADPDQHEARVAAGLAAVAGVAYGLIHFGHVRYVPHLLLGGVLVTAVMSVLSYGSVRTAVGFLFVAVVAGAGIFLGRLALLTTLLSSVGALGLLTWAEMQGKLGAPPDFSVDARVWITYTVTLAVVAVAAYYSGGQVREITAREQEEIERRHQAEIERDRSNERFARIFRTSPSPMLAQSARTGVILDVNPAFERCHGYTRDQVLGRTDSFLWAHEEQRSSYLQQLLTHRRADLPQVSSRRADGSTFEAQISSELGNDPQDRLVITTVADISTRIEAVERLRRSEERFAKAFNSSPLGMTIARLEDGLILEVNRSNERVLGYTQADFMGKTSLEVGLWFSEQERRDFVQQLRDEGRLEGYETRMRNKAGRWVPVRIWAETIDIDGEACSLAFTLNVETEKHREALLIEMAQGVSGATGEVFFRSLVTHLAQALEADMVIADELDTPETVQSVAAWHAGEIVPNVRYRCADTPTARTMNVNPGCHFTQQLRTDYPDHHHPIGSGFQTYLGIALRDADGSPIGVLRALWQSTRPLTADMQALMTIFGSRCTAELVRLRRDREIQKLQETLEQRVTQRTEQLEYLNRELDSFAYTVSHDLKSPLRSIGGFSHLLREQMDPRMNDDDRDLFDRIDTSVQRMSSLITDLLALARVSQGSLQRMNVNLSELAQDVIRQERHRNPTRDVQVRIAPGLMANCDARMAHIVLENLLGNAWKYTRQKALAVIEFGAVPRAPGQAPALFVRDNGAGFDMARAERLFKPFNRLHASSEFEGSGVGLATVRRILERHGGHIRGEGQVDAGSVFEFSFGSDTAR